MTFTNGNSETLKRAKMAAAALGLNLAAIARSCGCTAPHLHGVLTGERNPSVRLTDAIREAFGKTWPFVDGQVGTIEVQP